MHPFPGTASESTTNFTLRQSFLFNSTIRRPIDTLTRSSTSHLAMWATVITFESANRKRFEADFAKYSVDSARNLQMQGRRVRRLPMQRLRPWKATCLVRSQSRPLSGRDGIVFSRRLAKYLSTSPSASTKTILWSR